MLMEKELDKFRVARREMLLLYKDHGWNRKRSLSRDKSLDSKSVKTLEFEKEPTEPMKTRKTMKVLNEAKNGFDLIKI